MYRLVVGALQYATQTISYAINKVYQFMSNYLGTYYRVAKRILSYLNSTLSHGPHMQLASICHHFSITTLCDANWTSNIDDRKSTSVSAIFLGPLLISWCSCKQHVIARSNLEADVVALLNLLWKLSGQALLKELYISSFSPVMLCDN